MHSRGDQSCRDMATECVICGQASESNVHLVRSIRRCGGWCRPKRHASLFRACREGCWGGDGERRHIVQACAVEVQRCLLVLPIGLPCHVYRMQSSHTKTLRARRGCMPQACIGKAPERQPFCERRHPGGPPSIVFVSCHECTPQLLRNAGRAGDRSNAERRGGSMLSSGGHQVSPPTPHPLPDPP